MPRVFISYKWESDEHVSWVLRLATDLRNLGVESVLDQWEIRLGDSLSTYMSTKIGQADAVLFVITPGLVRALEAEQHKGGAIQIEMQMAIARKLHGHAIRLIPIYRSGEKVPTSLLDALYVDFRSDANYQFSLARLVSDLSGAPNVPIVSATSNPTLQLTRLVQESLMCVGKIGAISSELSLTPKDKRSEPLQRMAIQKQEFDRITDELAHFQGTFGYLFPPVVTNIAYLIWHELMDFHFYRLGLVNNDLHLVVRDMLPYFKPKIEFLQKVLEATASGRRPPKPAPDDIFLHSTFMKSAALPEGALDSETVERWLTNDVPSSARRASEA